MRVLGYHEHAVGTGANAQAVAYLELKIDDDEICFGVGRDADILTASLKAILSGVQRASAAPAVEAESRRPLADRAA